MSTDNKIPLVRATSLANRLMSAIAPYIIKGEIAGSVRRLNSTVGDIEVVVIENPKNPLSNYFVEGFKGLVVNGPRLKRLKYPEYGYQIELYVTSLEDYGRILAIRTGSSAFSHIKLATTWNRLGWCGTENGLRRKAECDKKGTVWRIKPEFKDKPTLPPRFETEKIFFEFLGIAWIPPSERNWISKYDKYNYSS